MATGQRFVVEQIVASGTFGSVCRVRDALAGQTVAAKVLKVEHIDNPRVVARTRDEASLLARLDHPNIVRVRELVEIHDRPVLLMEWIDGLNLEQVLSRVVGGLPPAVAMTAVRDVSDALHCAHVWLDASTGEQMSVIHRDIKPSNILLSAAGVFKLVDFGTATGRFAGRESETLSMVLGARGYTAPERLDGGSDLPTSDVYSLGHVLFELLTGQPLQLSLHPFHHKKMLDVALADLTLRGEPVGLTQDVRRLIERMVAYESGQRLGHREVAGHLRGLLALIRNKVDIADFAKEVVHPAIASQLTREPRRHPAWNEVRFLEGEPPMTADDLVREFLGRPDWMRAEVDLHRLLMRNPGWSPQPFLERLAQSSRSWWRFWAPQQLNSDETGILLRALALRPDGRVTREVEGLLGATASPLRRLAREILGASGRA